MATAPYFDGSQPCMQIDPDTFFPESPERPTVLKKEDPETYQIQFEVYSKQLLESKLQLIKAKAACSQCQFVTPCLEYALENDVVGVWGGTDEKDRREIRKSQGLPTPRSITLITDAYTKQKGAQ